MEKLLAIVMIGQKIYSRRLLQPVITHVVILIGLMIIGAIFISAMLVASLAGAYSVLIAYGVEQHTVVLLIGAAALLIIILLIALIHWRLKRLRHMPRALLEQSPITSCATDAFDAFLNGLMAD